MVALYVGLGIAMMTGISAMMQIGTNMNKIVIDNSMNAFVTGNDYIYIHTGLLENLDSYEELEGIIAHEIGHLKLGHVESRKILSKKNSNLINIGFFA